MARAFADLASSTACRAALHFLSFWRTVSSSLSGTPWCWGFRDKGKLGCSPQQPQSVRRGGGGVSSKQHVVVNHV